MKRQKGIDTEFIIEGAKYDTSPQYYQWDNKKMYPYYKEVEKKIFTPKGITSLNEAELWLLENEPEYYFGASIFEQYKMEPVDKEALDFSFIAIPSYYETIYDTTNRQDIIKQLIKEVENRMVKKISNVVELKNHILSEYQKYDVELNANHFDVEVENIWTKDLLLLYSNIQSQINEDFIIRLEKTDNNELNIISLTQSMKDELYTGNYKDFLLNLEKTDKSLCRFVTCEIDDFCLTDGESTFFFDEIDNYELLKDNEREYE